MVQSTKNIIIQQPIGCPDNVSITAQKIGERGWHYSAAEGDSGLEAHNYPSVFKALQALRIACLPVHCYAVEVDPVILGVKPQFTVVS